MPEVPFKLFPSSGYLNSEFQLVRFDEECRKVVIEKGGETVRTIDMAAAARVTLTEFGVAGTYTAKSVFNGNTVTQDFEIKNSIRFGTSELKSPFVFDEMPYSFFLMKDRLLIFDERNKYLLPENDISPTELKKIDSEHLLFVTRIESEGDGIVNYGIYSLKCFQIVWELLNVYREIRFLPNVKMLWVYNVFESKLLCYSFEDIANNPPVEVLSLDVKTFGEDPDLPDFLHLEEGDTIYLVNLRSAQVRSIKKQNHVALDRQGNLYQLRDGKLRHRCLVADAPLETEFEIPQDLNLSADTFLFVGRDFINDKSGEFELARQELARKKCPPDIERKWNTRIDLAADEKFESTACYHSIFSSSGGVIILTKRIISSMNAIVFQKDDAGEFQPVPAYTSSTSYSLSIMSRGINRQVTEPLNSLWVIFWNEELLIFKSDSTYYLIKNGEIVKRFRSYIEPLVLLGYNRNDYLCVATSYNRFSLFSWEDFETPLLENIEVLNKSCVRQHCILWYTGGKNTEAWGHVSGFSLSSKAGIQMNDSQKACFVKPLAFEFAESFILNSVKTLIDPRSGAVKDAVVGQVVRISESLNKVVSRRGDTIYVSAFNPNSGKFANEEVEIALTKFNEAYISPGGKLLVLLEQTGQYSLCDLENGERTYFSSGKFLAFSKEGNLVCEADTTRSARVFDPLTFQEITPPNYRYYKIISPDGNLYSQLSSKRKYYDKLNNRYVDRATFLEYERQFDLPFPADGAVSDQIHANRSAFFSQHHMRFEQLGINLSSTRWSIALVEQELVVEIGIVGTNVVAEVSLPAHLPYLNYAAFSYDNKFFGCVGKSSSKCGLLQIAKLDVDLENKTLSVSDYYSSTRSERAVWVCGFSRQGYFAAYNSEPITYTTVVSDELFKNRNSGDEVRSNLGHSKLTVYRRDGEWSEIHGKSFQCFSPSGKFMVLSEQGYEPLTMGGYGHQNSSVVHIASTSGGEIIASFLDHGDAIRTSKANSPKNIIFTAFSEDERKIMTMSQDGVVIVRNIDLSKFDDSKSTKATGKATVDAKQVFG